MAVLFANGILIVNGPLSSALMPRLANLEAQGKQKDLIQLYRNATQFVAVLVGATVTSLAFCSEELLNAWTGDASLAKYAGPIVSLYAWGNGILAVSAFPYYLQYAKGDLSLHLVGNIVFFLLFTPAIIVCAYKYGGLGAGGVWLGMNMITFIVWLPFVNRKFAPGINFQWYFNDILKIIIPILLVGFIFNSSIHKYSNSYFVFIHIFCSFIILLIVGSLFSSSFSFKTFFTKYKI